MNQQEPSTETSGLGERRRRREAERAARLAAEKTGQAQPLTRRELRRRQLEEQARLEAIATGELPLVDDDGRPLPPESAARAAAEAMTPEPPAEQAGEPARAEERPATTGAAAVRSRRSLRERAEEAAAAAPAEAPGERTATTRRPVVRAPHTAKGVRSLDATGALTGVQPVQAPATPTRPAPSSPEAPVTTDPAGWAGAAAFPAPRFPSVPDDSTIVIDAVPAAVGSSGATPDRAATGGAASGGAAPGEATSTPASAASARSAATPGAAPAPDTRETVEPPAPEPGPGPVFAPVRREPTEAERVRSAASPARFPSAASGPEAVAAAALDSAEETEEEDYEDARPQWASLAEFSAATSESPDEPGGSATLRGGEPARRSVRDRMVDAAGSVSASNAAETEEETGYVDEIETRNPAASLVKIVALVLAAVVIGLLIGLLAFNQGDDGASVRIQSLAVAASALVGHNP